MWVECCRNEGFVKARRVNPKNFFAELKRRVVARTSSFSFKNKNADVTEIAWRGTVNIEGID